MPTTITIESLQFGYQKKQNILDIPQLSIPTGQLTIFYGKSGCGKSTLLKIIAGLLPKYGGHLTGHINLPDHLNCGMMFQDPALQFALDTPRHEIEFALENQQVSAQRIPQLTQQALAEVGILHLADRHFTTLSGGEQQRASLAVIIAMNPQIILLDEPFASLDFHNRTLLIHQLKKLLQVGKTIIIADHDLAAYDSLQPTIIDFNNQIQPLSPAATEVLLNRFNQPHYVPASLPKANEPIAISLHNFTLRRQNQLLIQQPELTIFKNKVTLLTGESGSGKSSFFKTLTKIIPFTGTIQLFGRPLKAYSSRQLGQSLGLVFQNATDQFLKVTVQEELALSLKHGCHPYFNRSHLADAIEQLGLQHLNNQVVYSLSGGQKKKLQLLVMLMMGQPLLLLDEPFSGLDQQSVINVINLIHNCQQVLPQTILVISHQLTGIAPLIDYHLHLSDQKLSYQGEAKA